MLKVSSIEQRDIFYAFQIFIVDIREMNNFLNFFVKNLISFTVLFLAIQTKLRGECL